MANAAAKVTAAFFDSKGLHYEILGDDEEVIHFGLPMENREGIMLFLFFAPDGTSVSIRNFDLVKIPEGKKAQAIMVCNELNLHFKWVKFAYDDERKCIQATDDAVIQLDSCGDEVLRCSIQLMRVCDEAYPLIMKAIYV